MKELVFNKLTPNMMVGDVKKTVGFYSQVLGFDLVMAVPEDTQDIMTELPRDKTLAYAMMKNGEAEIMFQEKGSLSEDIPAFRGANIGASVSLYFDLNDVEALYETLKKDVEVVKDLHTTWYGVREFYIRDCNGYVLGFSQQIRS